MNIPTEREEIIMFCPNCGSKMMDGAMFCGNCGTRLAAQQPAPVVEAPAPVVEAPAPVVEAPAPVVEAPAPVVEAPAPVVEAPVYEAPVQQPVYQQPPVQQPVYQQPVYQQPVYQQPPVQQPVYQQPVYPQAPVTPAPKKQKKKKKLGWLWAILIILILGAGAVLALDYFDVIDLGIFGDSYVVLKEAVTYDGDDNETKYMSVEVNKKGLPETITIEEKGNDRTYEIQYNSKGQITSVTTTWDNGNEHYEEYDKYGNVIYAEDGDNEYEYEYSYDKKGNALETVCYINGDENYTIVREFDKHDNVTYYKHTDHEDEEYSYARSYEYEYNSKGDIIEEVCYDEDSGDELYTQTYEYDKKGNPTYFEYDYQGHVSYAEYEYDKKGNLVTLTNYDNNDEETYRYEYEYDKNGNRTARYAYYEDELEEYTEFSWFSKAKMLTDAQINVLSGLDIIAEK